MYPETVEEQILVPFHGPGGTAPITWGQKAILQDMRETGWTHNASGGHPLPPDTPVEPVAAKIGELMSRHPALRLKIETDADGRPYQRVAESGEGVLDLIDYADGAELEEAVRFADDLWYQRLLAPFDREREWPMKTAMVRHRGKTLCRLLTFDHLTVDGGSIALLLAELGVGGATPPPPDPRTVQLLELGRLQQTPELRRVSDRAMRYWEAHLRDIPPFTFGEPTHPEGRQGHRYWHGRFASPATYQAMLAIAERTGTDTSRVLYAIIATAVGRATGVSPLTARVIVNNRFRPGFANAIGMFAQNSVVSLDLADSTVDEVVYRARKASTASGMYAYYDPEQLEELMARLDAERGYPARITCRINDRRIVSRRAAEEAVRTAQPTMAQIKEKLGETFLSWDGSLEYLHEQAFITVEDFPDTVYLQVIFDMTCFTEAQVEALLRGVEEVAVAAAFDATVPTGVSPR